MTLDLEVQYAVESAGLPAEADFAQWAAAALEGRRPDAELVIRLVDETEGRQLNRLYRSKDYATNVLSFQAELPPGVDLPLLGDLVICAPVVAREAAEQGKAPAAHWAHMVVHGTLHLLGYDHKRDADAEAMEALETEIMGRLGFPNPY